jgi:hypothetical protein
MRRRALAALAAATLALAPMPAAAQVWVPLPNGDYGASFSYGTAATFRCAMHTVVLGECSTGPGSITYTRPTGSLTLTFTGSAATVTATTYGGQVVLLGTLTPTFTGSGPFIAPTPGREYWPIFTMSMTGLGLGSGSYGGHAFVESGGITIGATGANFVTSALPPPPSGRGSQIVVLDGIPVLRITETTTVPLLITGWIGITPEPATWVTLASGLLALGGLAMRRRRNGQ